MTTSKHPRCHHGNRAVKMLGCSRCVATAIQALSLVQCLDCTPLELGEIVVAAYPTAAALRRAKAAARKKIAANNKRQPSHHRSPA